MRHFTLAASCALLALAASADVRLKGFVGERLDGCIRNCVEQKDDRYLTDPFKAKSEIRWWRTEFWGKWMQSARPFADYADSAALREKMARSAAAIAATQEPNGYIGDYRPENRDRLHWDVWGHKYTLLGLLEAYRASGDAKALASARRLADYVRSVFGPGKRSLAASGHYHGLASLSILEPIVFLYRATNDKTYLDYAAWIVREMDDPKNPASPRLLTRAGIPPADYPDRAGGGAHNEISSRKAYESMSCWQGLLEYAETVGDARLVEAADRVARLIASTEINAAGGAAHDEEWYGGAANQTARFGRLQETCVTTTWLRLCEKLLKMTRDPFYAEQIERTFFNAYLGALRPDNAAFASYTPLDGARSVGQYHCNMHENCCNANGPRGFLAYLGSYLTSSGDEVWLNHFTSARASAPLASGGEAVFEVFSLYPRDGAVNVIVRTDRPRRFALNVRVPAWAQGASAQVVAAGECVLKADKVAPGAYLRFEREWKPGERLELAFPIVLRSAALGDFISFAAGPLVLARDARFGDGALAEPVRRAVTKAVPAAVRTRPWPATWTTWAVALPLGTHDEKPELNDVDVVRLCDYASAGAEWSPKSAYSVWLPLMQGSK